MPWAAIAGGAASVGSALISDRSARRSQQRNEALQREMLAENRRQFDLGMERQLPFHQAGVGAVNELANSRFRAPTAADVESDPGYAFGLREGRNALEGSAAAGGGLFSGNALKALTRYGTDYGTTKFNDVFERARSTYSTNANTLGNLINAGTGAATQMQNAGANFANSNANMLSQGGNAANAADIARGNIWGNVLNQGVSIGNRNNWWQNSGGGGGGGAGGFDYTPYADGSSPGGAGFGYADGGPVQLVEVAPGRYEPKVGTRSARPSSGGGNMGKKNVLEALRRGEGEQKAKRTGMAALPVNPVTNPAGVTRARLEQAEGYADGGPVMEMRDGRMVPKVGTRSARPGAAGTGGGMSRDQVLAALTAAQAASVPAPAGRTGMGALPVNPVTNPGGLRRVQMEDAGAYAMGGPVRDYDFGGAVRGPGGPREDAIPARLSNGEFVVNAKAVTNLGGGSNAAGLRKMNALQRLLEGM